jgi:uracil-DNA glycosylase family 4
MEDNNGAILLVFQAPGVDKWSNGRPVSSKAPNSAGGKLEAAFAHCGKARGSYNITNAVQCFPGKQEVKVGKRPRDKAPSVAARRLCANWLRQDINAHKYKKIVVFGSPARDTVLELGYRDDKRFVFVTHPTGGLSNAKLREAVS